MTRGAERRPEEMFVYSTEDGQAEIQRVQRPLPARRAKAHSDR